MKSLRFLLLALALLFLSHSGNAQGRTFHGLETVRGSGIDIKVVSAFAELPPGGYAPLQVTIGNQSGRPRTWNFRSVSSANYDGRRTVAYETALTVPHGETRVFDILAPLTRLNYYGDAVVQISGHGVRSSRIQLNGSFHHRHADTAIAMSERLASRNWGQLQAEHPTLNGSSFELKLTPNDWRAYSGFDQVWLSASEWRETDAARRLALLDWVSAGGTLFLCREESDTDPLPDLRGWTGNDPLARGFGEIRDHATTGNELDSAAAIHEMRRRTNGKHLDLENSYRRGNWPLLAKLDEVKLRRGLFIGFLVLFGIVIGPVNLFVFARGSHRHRLFWTTPALSFGASACIFLLILLQDGLGGTGHQLAIWSYQPDENKAVLIQEQTSRTALLTKRNFSVETPALLSAIEIGAIPSIDSGSFRVGRQTYSGDWFRNRSLQGHLLKTVTSTRSRIEITAASGGAPTALSTFPFPLETLYYLDENGFWWHGQNLRSGESQQLERADETAFKTARKTVAAEAGAIIKRQITDLPTAPGHFFAFTAAPAATAQTLSSIRWKTTTSLHTGPVVQEQSRP